MGLLNYYFEMCLQNAATHKANNDKTLVNLKWIPPAGFNGTVEFKLNNKKKIYAFN